MARRDANRSREGLTALEVMDEIDKMIQSSPDKAEAARRLAAVIGHAQSRAEYLTSYWLEITTPAEDESDEDTDIRRI